MGTTTKITFEQFLQLPEEPGKHYELSEGELVMEPSPTFRHNVIRSRIEKVLDNFVKKHDLGAVTVENDFRLAPQIVRNPDVAFITNEQFATYDLDQSPIEGTPTLAVEVISPGNSAQDMLLKVHQYLKAGCKSVWVFYPALNTLVVHDSEGTREFKDQFQESKLFGAVTFVLRLDYVFHPDLKQ